MKILAVIPARGGSKGVPGKNIKIIDGLPLISYSINVALDVFSPCDIVVSSDWDKILNIAQGYGVSIHKRDRELASDVSPIADTIFAVLNEFEKKNNTIYDLIMLLQPTSPIREMFHLEEAIDRINTHKDTNSLISVCKMTDMHPARMYNIKNEYLKPIIPEYETLHRQDIPPAYYRNGSIYIVRRNEFVKTNSLMTKPSIPYIMDVKYLANIDDYRDFLIAETLIKAWKNNTL
jgi:CMP-N-acetylneuraminic acid synthetase